MKTLVNKKLVARLIAFTAISICCATAGTAQIKLGVMGGMNMSNQHSNVETWNHSTSIDYSTALTAEVNLNQNFSLVLQPGLVGKGSSIEDDNQNDLVYEFDNRYVELPVLVRFSTGNKLRPFVQAGPYAAVLVKSELGGHFGDRPLKGDLKRVTQSFDTGIYAGVGISYTYKRIAFSLEANYHYGFMNTLQAGTVDISDGEDVTTGTINGIDVSKNKGLRVSFGISVPITGK